MPLICYVILLLVLDVVLIIGYVIQRADTKRERAIAVKYTLKYTEARTIARDLIREANTVASGLDRELLSREGAARLLLARAAAANVFLTNLLSPPELTPAAERSNLCRYCGSVPNENDFWKAEEGYFCNSEHYEQWRRDRCA